MEAKDGLPMQTSKKINLLVNSRRFGSKKYYNPTYIPIR